MPERTWRFDIGETDSIYLTVESGDVGGDEKRFLEEIYYTICDWYDGEQTVRKPVEVRRKVHD